MFVCDKALKINRPYTPLINMYMLTVKSELNLGSFSLNVSSLRLLRELRVSLN